MPAESLAEALNIKTDNPSRWRSRNDRAREDLQPRRDDPHKSSWASCREDDCTAADAVAHAAPSCKLHAVAFLIREQEAGRPRNKVNVVRIQRSALPSALVVDEPDTHVVACFDSSHRALMTHDASQCQQVLDALFRTGDVAVEQYSRESLLPLLRDLVSLGLVREQFQPVAEALLETAIG